MSSFARGLNEGLSAVSSMAGLMRTKKQMDREDSLQRVTDEANDAGKKAYQSFLEQQKPTTTESNSLSAQNMDAAGAGQFGQGGQAGVTQGLGLMNAAPSLADQTAQAGGMGQAVEGGLGGSLSLGGAAPAVGDQTKTTKPAKFDEREGILAGMSARRKFLMTNGAGPDVWGGEFAKETALREQLRAEPIKQAYEHYSATGDFGAYARKVYPLIDDGVSIKSAEQKMGVDGKPAGWMLTVAGEDGKERSVLVNEATQQRMLMMSASPEERVKYELQTALAKTKADEGIRQKQGEQDAVRETLKQNHGRKLAEIKVDGDDQRRTVAARTAGDIAATRAAEGERRTTDRTKPIVLSADATLVERDGKGEYKPVAKGKDKATGDDTPTSAPNKILQLRAQAESAMRSNPAAAKEIKARFKALSGKDY